MADSDVLREFLVKLGYSVDPAGERRFLDSIATATKGAVAFGAALEATALAAVGMAHRAAQSLERLSYATERTRTSANDLRAFEYSLSQVGGTAEQASAMVERFAEKMRANPEGLRHYLQSFLKPGEKVAQGAVGQIEQLINSDKFRSLPYFNQKQIAEQFGLSDADLQVLLRNHAKFFEEHKRRLREFGVSMDELGERSRKFEQAWRRVVDVLGVIGDKLELVLIKGLQPLLDWISAHEQDIEHFYQTFNHWAKETFGVDEAFEKLAIILTGATMASALGVLMRLVGLAGSSAWGSLASVLSGLGLLGAAGAVGGALLAPSPSGGAPDAEEERQQNLGKPERPAQNPNESFVERGKRAAKSWWQEHAPSWLGGGGEKQIPKGGKKTSYADPNDFFDAIMQAEGTAKSGDPYNTSLGYMKSPKPLTEMTMAEALAWGDQVRKAQGMNSSAKGAFQIVNSTQRAAMAALGIGPDEKFSEENQRRMASWIARKQGLSAWEGFKVHPDQMARAREALRAGRDRDYAANSKAAEYAAAERAASERRRSFAQRIASGLSMSAQAAEGGVGGSIMFSAHPLGHHSVFDYHPSSNIVNARHTINVTANGADPSSFGRGIAGALKQSNAELLRNMSGAAQ